MTPKEFMNRWGAGIKSLPPSALAKARVRGYFWGSIGLAIGLFFMLIRGMWFFVLFITAMIYLQWHEYRGARQNYANIKKLEDEMLEKEILKKL